MPGEWVAGWRPGPFRIKEPRPYQPWVAVVVDATSGWLFGVETLDQGAGPAEAAGAIVKVVKTQRPKTEPAFVETLRVDDAELAAVLRGHLGPGVAVRVGPTPEIDAVVRATGRAIGPGDDRQSYLENGRVTPEAVGRFFEAAAAVYRLAPWRIAQSDNQVLRLDAPTFGMEGACLSIIGGLGESHGVLVFESVDDFTEMAHVGTEEEIRAQGAGVPILSINFEARKNLPRGLASEAKRHGWPVAGPQAYPWLLSLDAHGHARALAERDYACATAVLDALAGFFGAHGAVFQDEPQTPVSRTVSIDRLPGKPSVTLTAPHPEADWNWLDGSPLDAEYWDEADALGNHFVADQVRGGRSAEWLRGAQAVIDDLFGYKIDTAGEPPLGWTAAQVDEYLLEYFPQMSGIPTEEAETTPEYLDAFFAWLGETGGEDPAVARELRSRIARRRHAFLQLASGPAAAGSPRSLAQVIRKRGIDPSDETAMAAVVEEWAARLEKEPIPGPAATGKRWQWTPGTPLPAPAAPCPCGSGVRYRKCCMPR